MLSRLHRKAEALDQACLRAAGHPHDYAIRQELLSALEWPVVLHPEHADPLIQDLFKQVHDHSIDLSKRIRSDADESKVPAHPIAEIQTLRQRLTKLVQVLAARLRKPRTD